MRTLHEQMTGNSIDNYSNFIGDIEDIKDFFVFLSQSRDSDPLERSNFKSALKALGGESKTVQVHRFGHWGCGWYEVILIDPTNVDAINEAEEIINSLEDYPVVDEDGYSASQNDEINDYWDGMSMSEKVQLCEELGISIFSVRYEMPEAIYYHIMDCYIN